MSAKISRGRQGSIQGPEKRAAAVSGAAAEPG